MKKIVIWGCGPTGISTLERIKDEFEVVAFSDNNTEVQGTKVCGIEVISPEKVYQLCREKSVHSIIMGASANNYDDVYQQIRSNMPEWKDVYYVTQWGERKLIPYTDRCLGYLEFDATRNCNLNCRGCLRYSNITEDTDAYSLENLEKDLKQLSGLFDNIAFVKILGGEPLLRKDLHEMLTLVKTYFPDTQLDVLTNGLLVPKIDSKLLKVIKELETQISITEYEPTRKMSKEIVEFCEKHDIPFKVYVTNRAEFLKQLNIKGDSDGHEIVKNCMSKKCTIIKDGIMNRCSQPSYIYELNRKYNLDLPEDIGINIYDKDVTREKIKRFLTENVEFCRFCTEPVMYTWKNGKKEVALSDWVVQGGNE